MRISVIGCGYLGAVHAACMAKLGHEVVGIDVDAAKVEHLSRGRAPFYEPVLDELLSELEESGRLRFTTEMSAAHGAEVHFICVGTPQKRGENGADLRFVDAAVEALAGYVSPGDVIAGKSTVPVGTAARLAELLAETEPGATLVWNPEFLREGHAVTDTLNPDRFVYGVPDGREDHPAVAVLDRVYATPLAGGTRRLITDYATAELVKAAANSFLATKISFINAMAEVCEATGADVTRLADAIGMDERIGRKFLNAGIGFGGGCLPKDIRAFMARAGELGADQALTFLREVDAINMRRRTRVVELTRELCGGSLMGQRIAVLGAAFKPESDDVRDSPALSAAAQLQLQGAVVTVTDPQALANAAKRFPELPLEPDLDAALHKADAVLLLTEWRQYRELDPHDTLALVSSPRILDGRNVLDPAKWRAAGWTYKGLGRP
ncbi:UDP-glucose/GDP-mannose dehydrogenase family protein [Arthrobacter sp. UKPF54-2]|uniref:UDP-glucose dehydrogenase family protein n=1 Tax=Arthrobacter sp. UKPF54-2 TaxID=2600159 RepID=UPI0011B1C103|nr:UDP-glucose/GDP-mannose dehydrogenase family protein [Arthrobacter sp. UKPF54-2]QDY88897.1 UDP-glucose/GDP-mannose dehydrogenase family protein [Arthrobacter sp. UKPF54-2]